MDSLVSFPGDNASNVGAMPIQVQRVLVRVLPVYRKTLVNDRTKKLQYMSS